MRYTPTPTSVGRAGGLTVESIVVHRMQGRGETERARKVDRLIRWLVPAGALAILTIATLVLWI